MKDELEQAVKAVCKCMFGADVTVELTRPDEQFGDYATNIALQLAGKLGNPPAGGPREIAAALQAELAKNLEGKAQISIAGPGFLNISLSDNALMESLGQKPAQVWAGKTVCLEYSDPNPLKPLHAGHLYTTLVGDSLSRLIEQSGANIIRINYGGDVGLHVGKSIWAIVKHLGG